MADLPPDVRETLGQLFAAADEAVRERRTADGLSAVESARTVATNKVPDEELRARLRHGCDRVAELAAAEPLVAAEYCRAMRDRVERHG